MINAQQSLEMQYYSICNYKNAFFRAVPDSWTVKKHQLEKYRKMLEIYNNKAKWNLSIILFKTFLHSVFWNWLKYKKLFLFCFVLLLKVGTRKGIKILSSDITTKSHIYTLTYHTVCKYFTPTTFHGTHSKLNYKRYIMPQIFAACKNVRKYYE